MPTTNPPEQTCYPAVRHSDGMINRSVRGRLGLLLVSLAVAVGVVFGLIGYLRAHRSVPDAIYDSLNLFSGSFSTTGSHVPWTLEVARISALAATFGGVAAVLVAFGHDRIDALRAILYRKHVVIAGGGANGALIALTFRQHGSHVVLIDGTVDDAMAVVVRDAGVRLVRQPGAADYNPTPVLLASARRARAVVVATGDDARNALIIKRIAATQPPPRSCLAFSDDLATCELFRESIGFGSHIKAGHHYGIDFFNLHENVAQDHVRRLIAQATQAKRRILTVAVIGSSDLAVAVLLQLRRQARAAPLNPLSVKVVLVHSATTDWLTGLQDLWPELVSAAGWSIDTTASHPDSARMASDIIAATGGAPDQAFVVGEPDAMSFHIAAKLSERFPTTVWVDGASAISEVVAENLPRLRLVDVKDEGLRPDLVEDSVVRLLARAAHEWYLAGNEAAGSAGGTTGSWDQISEDMQDDNVRQVTFLRDEFDRANFVILRRSRTRNDPSSPPPQRLIEEIAVKEHERWWANKRRLNAEHPDMKEWSALDVDAKRKDIEAVARFPQIVASIGYVLVPKDAWSPYEEV